MKLKIFLLFAIALFTGALNAQSGTFVWTNGAPTAAPPASGAQFAVDRATFRWYEWTGVSWVLSGDRIQTISGCSAPNYTPGNHQSQVVINGCTPPNVPELYFYTGSVWVKLNDGATYTAGTGIGISGTVISNTGDLSNTNELQTLSIAGQNLTLSNGGGTVTLPGTTYTGGTGISVSGTVISADTAVLATQYDLSQVGVTWPLLAPTDYVGNYGFAGRQAGLRHDGDFLELYTNNEDNAPNTILVNSGSTVNSNGGNIIIYAGSSAASDGGAVSIVSGDGQTGGAFTLNAGSGQYTGGDFTLNAGGGAQGGGFTASAGTGTSDGGSFTLSAGDGAGQGGNFVMNGGNGDAGGSVNINAGNSVSENGASVIINSGTSTGGGNGGNIFVVTGAGANPGFFTVQNPYTPTNSADANGTDGAISWDSSFIYVKTATGWKRAQLTTLTELAGTGNRLATLNSDGGFVRSSIDPANIPTTAGTGIGISGGVISNTGDLSNTNELQTLSLTGSDLTLSNGGGTVALPSGGTPGGSNTQIQFNNSGVFGANSNFTWDNAKQSLSVGVASDATAKLGIGGANAYTESSITLSNVVTNATKSITYDSNTNVEVGDIVVGTNIPAASHVIRVISATSAVLNNPATGSGTNTATLTKPLTGAKIQTAQTQGAVNNYYSAGLFVNPTHTYSTGNVKTSGAFISNPDASTISNGATIQSLSRTQLTLNRISGSSGAHQWYFGIGDATGNENRGDMYIGRGEFFPGDGTHNLRLDALGISVGQNGFIGGDNSTQTLTLWGGQSTSGVASGNALNVRWRPANTINHTSGNVSLIAIDGSINGQNFAPTSGSGTVSYIAVSPTLNQTGTASGIIRGFRYNPTVTSVRGPHYAATFSSGQVGIGTDTPNASAQLDVQSTTGGVLFPRMTGTQRDAIASPADGLMIYNTTAAKLQVRAAGVWVDLH